MSIKDNHCNDIYYPCPVCLNADICKYKDRVGEIIGTSSIITIGKMRFECSRYNDVNKNIYNKPIHNDVDTRGMSLEDNEKCAKVADLFDIPHDDVTMIEECPICKKKHVPAVKCDKCNRHVCINCVEAEDSLTSLADVPDPITTFLCVDCCDEG